MFNDFETYSGQVISQADYEAALDQAPEQSPEQIAASIIEEANERASAILEKARKDAEEIASEGLLGQLLTLEAEKQKELDKAVENLTGLVSEVVEEIIGTMPSERVASDIFKRALKKFDETQALVVEAAKDVYPRLQLLARIDQARNPGRIKMVEKADFEPGKIVIQAGSQRFHADATSQIETFRRAILALNEQPVRRSSQ